MIQRKPGWRKLLSDYISEVRETQFQWGVCDCALFAAGCVRAQTGVDLARGWRGYSTASGSIKKLKERGFDTVVDAAADVLPKANGRLRAGDLAVVHSDDGPALGVVQGRFVYVMTPSGLGQVPLDLNMEGFYV